MLASTHANSGVLLPFHTSLSHEGANTLSQAQHVQEWSGALRRAYGLLQRYELQQAEQYKSHDDVEAGITRLQSQSTSESIMDALSALSSTLKIFVKSTASLQEQFGVDIKVAGFWGLLYVLIEASTQQAEMNARICRMLKSIANKIELINAYNTNDFRLDQLGKVLLDIHVDSVSFLASAICLLRGYENYGTPFLTAGTAVLLKRIVFANIKEDPADEDAWHQLAVAFNSCSQDLDEATQRVEKLARLAMHIDEVQKLQLFLSLQNTKDDASLPCIILPPARNARFYNRDDIIAQIDDFFNSKSGQHISSATQFRSIALYGLGGVGKSHVALKYAHSRLQHLSAILWIQSETSAALEQSFTDIAIRLKLPGAEPMKHEENRIQVLDWLQKTESSWLLIFDNAEDVNLLLKYWPISKHGSALLTTRNHSLAFDPADTGIEILPFDVESGSKFILHLLSMDIAADISKVESQSASDLSERLSGHALAIAQMAGLIHRRSWTIHDFVKIYDRNTQKLLGAPGHNSLDAVWKLSFESLDDHSGAVLGILSYLTPHTIPQALFEMDDGGDWPESLSFCNDELEFSEAIDNLITLALIKRDKSARTFAIHRLVQTQFQYFLSPDERQRAFDDATAVLYNAFPKLDSKKGQLYDHWTRCQLYAQHVLSLKDNYKRNASGQDSLRPTVTFCKLLLAFSRYLIESAGYGELADLVVVLQEAFDTLSPQDQDQNLAAGICISTGLLHAHKGYFSLAEPYYRQAYDIRSKQTPIDLLSRSWTEVNLGNIAASMCNYGEALNWELTALKSRQQSGETSSEAPQGIVFQNIARSYLVAGHYTESFVWCSMAIGVLENSQNWGMVAYTRFVLGNLYRAQRNFDKAMTEFRTASDVWVNRGQLKTHHFNGACLYKMGCVALDLDKRDLSITYLREGFVIAQLHQQVLVGDYARVLHKLSEVLATTDEYRAEAELKAAEARSLLSSLRPSVSESAEKTDEEVYDKLVYNLWR